MYGEAGTDHMEGGENNDTVDRPPSPRTAKGDWYIFPGEVHSVGRLAWWQRLPPRSM